MPTVPKSRYKRKAQQSLLNYKAQSPTSGATVPTHVRTSQNFLILELEHCVYKISIFFPTLNHVNPVRPLPSDFSKVCFDYSPICH